MLQKGLRMGIVIFCGLSVGAEGSSDWRSPCHSLVGETFPKPNAFGKGILLRFPLNFQ